MGGLSLFKREYNRTPSPLEVIEMPQLNIGADQAGQWYADIRAAASVLRALHGSNTDELAQRLCDMADTIAEQ